ncbi:protein of unknown function DUF214 [Acidimicrobium ferrooxidans DSM 10331]|uniref:ABC3 transporter permease C-terminal domain-containing protein n=2 Tax=Acidimicrobium ferrooxidans TaxID=53635 RepID=C7LZ35_ACIFD|nr:protein of unknown function DUF214 [Acidimicrobium ferrooxidans DSM 10331]
MLVVTGTLAVATVILAPLYIPSAKDALVVSVVRATSLQQDGLQLNGFGLSDDSRAALERLFARAPRLDHRPLFGSPLATAFMTVSLPSLKIPSRTPGGVAQSVVQTTALLERTAICSHLRFVAGTCPRRGSQGVAVSTRDAAALHLHVGSNVTFAAGAIAPGTPGALPSVKAPVVGIYDPPTTLSAYWWGTQYFDFSSTPTGNVYDPFVVAPGYFDGIAIPGPPVVLRGHGTATSPAFVVGSQYRYLVALSSSGSPGGVFFAANSLLGRTLQAPLAAPQRITNTTAPGLLRSISGYLDSVNKHAALNVVGSQGFGPLPVAASSLPGTLTKALAHQHSFSTISIVVVVEMLAIGELVLSAVIARSILARDPELRLAQLRGLGTRRIVQRAIAEPLVAIVLTIPLGTAVGVGVMHLVASRVLPSGVTVTLTTTAVLTAVGTAVVGLLTTAVIIMIAVRRGVVEAPRATQRRRVVFRVALDVALLAIAATGTFELVTAISASSGIAPLAAGAPALLALGLSVIAAWLLTITARLVARLTRSLKRPSVYVATRQLRQRASALHRALVVGLAIGLVTFGIGLDDVGNSLARTGAAVTNGATEVAEVTLPPSLTIAEAVDRADPSGHEAMAAQRVSTPAGTTLAIQARRAPGILTWSPTLGLHPALAQVVQGLDPRSAGGFPVRGRRVAVTVEISLTKAQAAQLERSSAGTVTPATLGVSTVTMEITTPTPAGLIESVGVLSGAGKAVTVSANVPTACRSGGCDLVGISFSLAQTFTNFEISILGVSGIAPSPGGPVLAASSWRASGALHRASRPASWTVAPSQGALDLVPRSLPPTIPAITTDLPPGQATAQIVGLDSSTITATPIAQEHALPVLGASGAIVDLRLAEQYLQATDHAQSLVFLGPRDPSAVLRSLAAEGAHVGPITTVAQIVTAARTSPTALAQDLVLPAGIAAAVLVAAGLLFETVTDGRARIAELAALRVLGMRRSQLVTALVLEGIAVVVLGAVVGVVAGVVGAHFVLPHVLPPPTTLAASFVIPYSLPTAPLARAALLVVILGGAAVLASAVRVVARASFEQLRAGER